MKNECSLDLSTIGIPPDWTRYPLRFPREAGVRRLDREGRPRRCGFPRASGGESLAETLAREYLTFSPLVRG